MDCWGNTDIGKVRKTNQDTYGVIKDPANNIMVCCVCDGMGGANAGDVASKLACEAFLDKFNELYKNYDFTPETLLQESVNFANNVVHWKSLESDKLDGMGTTLVSAYIMSDRAYIINVGDSRAYHISESGIEIITRDHSLVEDMVQKGEISRREAEKHPSRNLITRAVGTCESVRGDIFFVDLEPNDYLLLCSDGLSNVVSEQEILFEILHDGNADTCCDRLIEIALQNGAPDNVTIVLAKN